LIVLFKEQKSLLMPECRDNPSFGVQDFIMETLFESKLTTVGQADHQTYKAL
jgi:hypothetical protein